MEGYIDLTLGDKLLTSIQRLDMNLFADHLEQKEKEWNAAFSQYDCTSGLRFSSKGPVLAARTVPQMFMSKVPVVEWLQGDGEGTVYDTQIQTTVDALHQILENPGRSGVIIGPTMCGKTGTANNCQFLAPILTLLTGKMHVLINLLPNKRSIEEQAKDDWRRFLAFYSDCQIVHGDRKVSLGEFYQALSSADGPMSRLYPLADDRRSNRGNIHRRSKAAIKILEEFNEYRKGQDIRYVFLTDEVHEAARKDSIQSKIYDQIANDLQEDGRGDIIIGFSATPWQLTNLSKIWKVRHRLSDNYCGLNFFNGEKIDPDANCSRPRILCPVSFCAESGVDLSYVSRSAFRKSERFHEIRQRQRKNGPRLHEVDLRDYASHQDYKEDCFAAIAQSMNWCLVNGKPCGESGTGLFIRFCTNNDDLIEFENGLRRNGLKEDIKFLSYSGSNVRNKAYKFIMNDEHVKAGKPFVILVTGSGRMADRFPANIKYYFDFTETSNDTALIQGTHGRATGNNKGNPPPWVFFVGKLAEHLRGFINGMGVPFKKPHSDTVLLTEDGKPVPRNENKHSIVMLYEHAEADPEIMGVWEWFEKEIVYSIPNGDRPRGKGFYSGVWHDMFSEEFLSRLERLFGPHARILRPGELDAGDGDPDAGWGWAKKDKDPTACKIGFRTAKGPASANSNLPSDRDLPGGENRDKKNRWRLEIQAHVWPPQRRGRGWTNWKLVGIRFRLKERVTIYHTGGMVLPNSKTYWENYTTQEERNLVDAANS